MVKIEDDVPIGGVKCHPGPNGRRSKYPFMVMAVGQSVFYEREQAGLRAYDAAKQAERRCHDGRRFTMGREGMGVRIWRNG